jgi:uncharacterized membrane protein (UPF0182 family)
MQSDPLFDDQVIDIKPKKRRPWLYVVLAVLLLAFFFGSQILSVYIDALWFASVGYSNVYWYKFRLGGLLFAVFLALTFLILRLSFAALSRAVPQLTERPRVRLVSVEDLREVNFLPLLYRPGVWIISGLVALLYATRMSQSWSQFALYLNAQPAGAADPIFGKDVTFYLFTLPVLELVSGWLTTVAFVIFAVVTGACAYVWYVEQAQGFGTAQIRRTATAAISVAAAFFAAALALSTYLGRYDLLHSRHEIFTGVSYTDANARLPGLMAVVVALGLAAALLLANAFLMRRARLIWWAAGGVIAVWLVAVVIIPQSLYSFSVKPNELAKESPYIQNNIEMTRRAFGLDKFEEKPFQPAPTLTAGQIEQNERTIENIRLWDPEVFQANISQNQAIRTYYRFNLPDVDRYVINGELKQVLLAARELNADQLQDQSKNWINQHLVYTHGYGVTMSPVNEFTPEGGPNLILKNMPVESDAPEIKVTRPEIYFGEVTNLHVYVNTKPQGTTQPEFSYPAPDNTDSYSQYEGGAGIPVGGFIRQAALSLYLGDGTNLLLSDYIMPESRVLMRRNVLERVRAIAPFLIFENDPYIVIARDGRLFWIVDGFTYSSRYPYSSQLPMAGAAVNYVRNSVKAVVDAYEGAVKFYVFEPDDPIIRSYQSIFPSLFVPSGEMPEDLLQHVRYPDVLAEVQARAYTLYHMQNPQTFYNREDQWAFAQVDPGMEGEQARPMQPYYVLMALPGDTDPEFVSILPFTPAGEGRNNMIGWIAQRSDGEKYGQTLVYSFPKNITVSGPAQIKARVNQDAQLSQLISLWNQQGSRIIRGNLQVIPIADSLLYIEPIYLRAVNSPLPELRQVAVATQDRVGSGKTFDEALRILFPQLQLRTDGQVARGQEQAAQGPSAGAQAGAAQPAPAPGQPPPQQPAAAQPAANLTQLAQQAQQLLSDYERLTAEGRHREAGDKLDQLKRTLAELNNRRRGE